MPNLAGLHDLGGEHLFGNSPGWVVDAIAFNETRSRDYRPYANAGFSVISRLNWGWNPHGTIPEPAQYGEMARLCRDFVAASPGCNTWIIGNEFNHSVERPNGREIKPEDAANCHRLCYQAIKQVQPDSTVLVAALAPWNNESGNWLQYLRRLVSAVGNQCDGYALHAYTHGTDPALVFSDQMVNGWYWHFRTYRQQLLTIITERIAAIKAKFHITESDQDEAWADRNSGWVQNAVKEIHDYNQQAGDGPFIDSISFYRWKNYAPHDKWGIEHKQGVIEDFKAAIGRGYTSPVGKADTMPEKQFFPHVPNESTPAQPQPDLPQREIDPRLKERGVSIDVTATHDLAPGQKYWRVARARWWNEQEAGGRHHIYLEAIDESGKPVPVAVNVRWPSGSTDARTNGQFGFDAGNFPMSKSLNEFSVTVDNDDYPSETLKGIGMGANGNSGIHTSTGVTFQLTTMPQAQPQPPTEQPKPEPTKPTIPVAPGDERDNWTRAIAFVRRWEGGWADNPNDPGGATNKGITIGTFQRWRAARGLPMPTKDDLRNITDAEVNQIYYEWYWKESGADKLPWPLALAHFDTAVNGGTGRAKEMLQKSSGNFLAYMGHLIDWYTRIQNFEHFGRAWIRRRAEILLEASKP